MGELGRRLGIVRQIFAERGLWGGVVEVVSRVVGHVRAAQVAADARWVMRRMQEGESGLFIDAGSNLGQGFGFFCQHYPLTRFDYVLMEPNPACVAHLKKHILKGLKGVDLVEKAASDKDGTARFFGLAEGGETSQGASLLDDHCNALYATDTAAAIEVPTLDFAAFLESKAKTYKTIVCKMDIEGGEYVVLPHVIAMGALPRLTMLYAEFHSAFAKGAQKAERETAEKSFITAFKGAGVRFRLWG